MAEIRPYKIAITDAALSRLNQKLDLTTLPDGIEDADWNYGTPLPDIKRLKAHWEKGFDWRKHEAKLNEIPQFKVKVQVKGFEDVDMHFLYQKSEVEGAIPLLFVHGWPGCFLEAAKLFPLLKDSKDRPAFHIVAPSLPNFGFSSRVMKKGFAMAQYAEALNGVMLALGYDKYVTQGGDWGFIITRALGHLYPQHVKAIHTNWPFAPFPSFTASPLLAAKSLIKHVLGSYTPQEATKLAEAKAFSTGTGLGYRIFFSTKPQTLNYSLNDSPIGLLAFIYEKLISWSDAYPWTDDEILTWISIYWFSDAGPGASGFIYYETANDKQWKLERLQGFVDIPLGFSYFPKELVSLPKGWLRGMGKVVFVGEHERGGHFAAYENPEAIAKDLVEMFGRGSGVFGVLDGRSGY